MGSSIKRDVGIRLFFSTIITGFCMWVEAGLYHNLLMPLLDPNVEAHHDGLVLMLLSYFILAFLMSVLFSQLINQKKGNGVLFGIIIGILWVFPHGLAMASAHNTSILYEIKNCFWHIFEQGVGGLIIASVFTFRKKHLTTAST